MATYVKEECSTDDINSTISEVETEILPPLADKMLENPVRTLQEMCMTHHWNLPYYTVVEEDITLSKPLLLFVYFTVIKKQGKGSPKIS